MGSDIFSPPAPVAQGWCTDRAKKGADSKLVRLNIHGIFPVQFVSFLPTIIFHGSIDSNYLGRNS
jgi:hypothetical protein